MMVGRLEGDQLSLSQSRLSGYKPSTADNDFVGLYAESAPISGQGAFSYSKTTRWYGHFALYHVSHLSLSESGPAPYMLT